MAPVAVPELVLDEDARIALAQTGDALDEANARLVASHSWYDGVRTRYSKLK